MSGQQQAAQQPREVSSFELSHETGARMDGGLTLATEGGAFLIEARGFYSVAELEYLLGQLREANKHAPKFLHQRSAAARVGAK